MFSNFIFSPAPKDVQHVFGSVDKGQIDVFTRLWHLKS